MALICTSKINSSNLKYTKCHNYLLVLFVTYYNIVTGTQDYIWDCPYSTNFSSVTL
jgi:hypothetical protein